MVTACGAGFEVVKSGEQAERSDVVACVCSENVPCALVVALLVVGNAFVRVVEVVGYIPVRVVRAHLDTGSEVEGVGEFPVEENSNRCGIVIVCRSPRKVRDGRGIDQLRVDVHRCAARGVRERERRGIVKALEGKRL